MAESAHGIAGTCMAETAEGPVAMAETPGKGFAVLTRLPSDRLGFRQLIKVLTAGPVPRSGVAAAVRAVEPSGEGQVLTGTVRDTHVLFLTAGVLCGE
jgi:hypothetical protein